MGRTEPKHKGVGLVPVVKGIKGSPRARERVPASLQHYLGESVLASAWYPERDYNALITLLASTLDAKQVGGDVWAFFGRVAAQRDLAGDQAAVPQASRVDHAGVYRTFLNTDPHDIAGLFSRLTKMWTLYHDTGRAMCARHAHEAEVVVWRLVDFAFPARGLADLQTAYFEEYARLSGVVVKGALARFSSDLQSGCEWHYRVASDPEKLRSIATLPLL